MMALNRKLAEGSSEINQPSIKSAGRVRKISLAFKCRAVGSWCAVLRVEEAPPLSLISWANAPPQQQQQQQQPKVAKGTASSREAGWVVSNEPCSAPPLHPYSAHHANRLSEKPAAQRPAVLHPNQAKASPRGRGGKRTGLETSVHP